MTYAERDLVRLHSGNSGMTPNLMRRILQSVHDSGETLASIFALSVADLNAMFGIPEKVARVLISTTEEKTDHTLAKLREKRFRVVSYLDDEYPNTLKRFDDIAPPLLYIHGDSTLLNYPGVGFGGSRNVSSAGLHAADELARSAVNDHGMIVISGHAKGVDLIAHQSALATGGATILVLPEGALTFRLNADLRVYWGEAANRIVVITQFAPHEPWAARNAMTRNSTVIGLSQAFCVIESGDETGGTWAAGITTQKMGVPLYVLDYETPPTSASGNAKLIANGGFPLKHRPQMTLPATLSHSDNIETTPADASIPVQQRLL